MFLAIVLEHVIFTFQVVSCNLTRSDQSIQTWKYLARKQSETIIEIRK